MCSVLDTTEKTPNMDESTEECKDLVWPSETDCVDKAPSAAATTSIAPQRLELRLHNVIEELKRVRQLLEGAFAACNQYLETLKASEQAAPLDFTGVEYSGDEKCDPKSATDDEEIENMIAEFALSSKGQKAPRKQKSPQFTTQESQLIEKVLRKFKEENSNYEIQRADFTKNIHRLFAEKVEKGEAGFHARDPSQIQYRLGRMPCLKEIFKSGKDSDAEQQPKKKRKTHREDKEKKPKE